MSGPNKPRGRIAGLLMGIGVIVLPIFLGTVRRQDPEKEYLQESIAQGHEVRDLSVRGIVWFGIGLLLMGACALIVSTTVLVVSSKQGGISYQYPPININNAPAPTLPPEPRLEQVPGLQLQGLRSQEDQLLNTYGWIDQKAGAVHIPIDRAIELMLQRGLPSRPAGQGNFQDNGKQSPSYPSSGRQQESFP